MTHNHPTRRNHHACPPDPNGWLWWDSEPDPPPTAREERLRFAIQMALLGGLLLIGLLVLGVRLP